MKVSLSGLLKNAAREPGYKYSLGELCEHLKLLRDQPERHSEFFDLYVFSDDSEYRASKKEEAAPSASNNSASASCEQCKYRDEAADMWPCECCSQRCDDMFTQRT